jgi:hypothetical protein
MYNAEYAHRYREAHREEILAYKKHYRKKYREKVAEGKHNWYLKNSEHVIAKSKKRAQEHLEEESMRLQKYARLHPKERSVARRRWIERNPEKQRAHQQLNNAVRRGKLISPEECEQCGKLKCRLEAHHEDYSKPLEVNWLCCSCHVKRTLEIRQLFSD